MTETRAPHDPGGKWEVIGPLDCPVIFRRTLFACRFGKVMLHHFVPNATDKDPHDHPSSFVTIVLRGGYDDMAWQGEAGGYLRDHVRAPAVRYRRAEHAHITKAHPDGAFSICIMGPKRRDWGFFRDGLRWPWRKYEEKYGLNWRCE